MTTALTTQQDLPKDERTGLTLPLSKHLGLRALAEHRAMLAMECEYLAKKFDRFGWERERNTPAQDRQKLDFMDALQDFPLDEVQAACKAAVLENPNRMPNEGHIRAQIMAARKRAVQHLPKQESAVSLPEPTAEEKARVAAMVRAAGFATKRAGGGAA